MDTQEKVFTAILVFVLLIMPVTTLFLMTCLRDKSVDCSKVVSVGGCDRAGGCGVTLENGEIRYMNYPSIGSVSCRIEHRWVWEQQ